MRRAALDSRWVEPMGAMDGTAKTRGDEASWELRAPSPLSPCQSGDEAFNEVIAALRDSRNAVAWQAARMRLVDDPRPSDVPHLIALLSPAALDAGTARWDGELYAQLSADDRRAYDLALRAAIDPRVERLRYVEVLAAACLGSVDGEAHFAAVFRGAGDRELKVMLAKAALASRRAGRVALEAVSEAIDTPSPSPHLFHLRGGGAAALVRLDPAGAFQRLSPYFSDHRTATAEGSEHASHILSGLNGVARLLDDRWRTLLYHLLGRSQSVGVWALGALLEMGPHPSLAGPLTEFLDAEERRTHFINPLGLEMLARIADRRAVPLLLRALGHEHAPFHLVLDGLRRAGDPSAAPAIRAWRKRQREAGKEDSGLSMVQQVREVLEELEGSSVSS